MSSKPLVPTDFDGLTPAWLTNVLRGAGLLSEARIVEVSARPLGAGQGFVGDIARLRLRLDREEPGAPDSVIAKLPTAHRRNRGFAQMHGLYEKEIRFYQELAPSVGISVPRLYYAHFDETSGAEHGQAVARFLDRLPFWLLMPLVVLSAFLNRFNSNRYLLLIEDLAPAEVGDQVHGCSLEDSERALRTLARLHARFWADPRLPDLWWVAPVDLVRRSTHRLFRKERPRYSARIGTKFDVDTKAALERWLDWIDIDGEAILRHLGEAPWTLLHADYRLDNLFFTEDGRVVVADWQSSARGAAALDVAYFLSGAIRETTLLSDVERLLDAYHQELLAGGVTSYARTRLGRDYRIGLAAVIQRLALGETPLFDLGGERGRDLMDTWSARAANLLSETTPEQLDLDSNLAERAAG